MTHIVSAEAYPTKKLFKECVAADPGRIYLDDPSIFQPVSGRLPAVLEAKGGQVTVTNHPKRSWFATVKKVGVEIRVIE